MATFLDRSAAVRSYWGHLMRNGTARREFPDIQIHNIVTLATRVRIQILKVTLFCIGIIIYRVKSLSTYDYICYNQNISLYWYYYIPSQIIFIL
jgi:hypothetical protein